ncbi:hypothetical protein SUGI_0869030 [Cryptomeria japonica]|uniref:phosphatidylinositol 4-kinase gamma 4-like n=1 Tax=Cryptomeria japonica TaxID=3369 RepID=UPI002414BB77|nr:phosphatidylinositol 4-kinase gamma 4-like [Cryptomeria japonica]GLJ41976.1 hypothetical protein SUGI_0869030 [Cryptomeria japonica]
MTSAIQKIINYAIPTRELRKSIDWLFQQHRRRSSKSRSRSRSKSRSRDDIIIEPLIPSSTHKLSPVCEDMIEAIRQGLESGQSPIKVSDGTGGVYFMPNAKGKIIGVFKPMDEEPYALNNPKNYTSTTKEPYMTKGVKAGEGWYRELATYILDHPLRGPRKNGDDEVGFAGVPPTMLVKCCHAVFNGNSEMNKVKVGSLQKYVKNGYSCEEMGSSKIPVNEVHMISILDIRLANADRHVGNILYLENIDSPDRLVPIDHGYCLPESFEGITLEWRFWRQAYMPYSLEMLKYIESLDAEKDIEMLKLHKLKISPESCLVLRISTMLLKKSAAAGLTANNIACIMCKVKVDVEASDIEIILEEAEKAIPPGSSEVVFLEAVSVKIDSYIANMKK